MGSAGVLSRIAEIPQSEPALAQLGVPAGPLRLRRAWPRSPARLTLEYTVGDSVVAGHWHSDPEATRHAADGDRMQLVAADGEMLVLQAAGTDSRLCGLSPAVRRRGARLVSHRAERRATVAVPGAFLKVVMPGRVAGVAAAHRAVSAVAAAPVLWEDDQAGILTIGAVDGRSLHDLLAQPGAAGVVRTTGGAVRQLHAQSLPDGLPGGGHGPRQEAGVLTDWLERLRWHAPGAYARIGARARRVLDDLAALPESPLRLIHRDLHDKQILVGEDGCVTLIDLDTLTAGDPAIDLANLAAHFDLRARQAGGDPETAGALGDALLEGYGAPVALRRRVEIYQRAALLRLACVYAFRPRWAAVATSLAEEGARPS